MMSPWGCHGTYNRSDFKANSVFATELALKSLRLRTGCYNFSSHPILLFSSRDMYWREHSTLSHLCQYVFPHVKPPWQSPNHFHLLLRVSGMHCRIICRPSQLFLFLKELSNIIYSCLLTLTVVQNLVLLLLLLLLLQKLDYTPMSVCDDES